MNRNYGTPVNIVNKTVECVHGRVYRRRLPEVIKEIVIHRNDVAETALELCTLFENREDLKEVTGGQPPYHFLVRRDGMVEQMLPVEVIGAHVRGFNKSTIGIVCVGDFRVHPPTSQQLTSATKLCGALLDFFKLPTEAVKGHSDYPEVTKACPGKHFDLALMRKNLAFTAVVT